MPKGGKKHGNLTGQTAKRYEAMRAEGMSKEKAARIANSMKGRKKKLK